MAAQRIRKMRRHAPMHKTDCGSKTRWLHEESARRALGNLRRENPQAFTSTVRPYRCPFCKKWHLGHE